MESAGELLVVDDGDIDQDEVLNHLLAGVNRVQVTSSGDCLQQLVKSPPDLIILRLDNPLRLAKKVLSCLAGMKDPACVMVILKQEQAEQLLSLLEAGIDDYVLLPVVDLCLVDYAVRRNLTNRARLLAWREKDEEFAAVNERLSTSLRILERDQRAGSRVQKNMMPKAPLPVGNVTFNYRIRPSLILSGDFIDYFSLSDGQMLFFIADVSGHGASSAFVTVLLKNQVRRARAQYKNGELNTPGDMLNWLNRELLDIQLEHHVTMFLGMLDVKGGRSLSYANAAHFPGPLLHTEEETRYLCIGGLPLGLSARAEYQNMQVNLPRKYSLVLVSDGVFEVMAKCSLQDKENRLLSIVDSGHTDVDTLFSELELERRGEIPDDIAVFTITADA